MKNTLTRAAVALVISTLSGCAPIVIAGAVITAASNDDNRTIGVQVDDQAISFRISQVLNAKYGQIALIRWNVQVYKGNVVLAGQVPSKIVSSEFFENVKKVTSVKNVNNELEITTPASYTQRASDIAAKALIAGALIEKKDIESQALSIMVENGVAHISGGVDSKQKNAAADIAKYTKGIRLVIKHF